MNIGFQNGQKVFAGVSESGWTIGFGSYTEDESDLPQFSIGPQITVNPSTSLKFQVQIPKLQCSILWLILAMVLFPRRLLSLTVTGLFLAQVSPELTSNSMDSSTVVTWPSGIMSRLSPTGMLMEKR